MWPWTWWWTFSPETEINSSCAKALSVYCLIDHFDTFLLIALWCIRINALITSLPMWLTMLASVLLSEVHCVLLVEIGHPSWGVRLAPMVLDNFTLCVTCLSLHFKLVLCSLIRPVSLHQSSLPLYAHGFTSFCLFPVFWSFWTLFPLRHHHFSLSTLPPTWQ